jgi:hypothetical protein
VGQQGWPTPPQVAHIPGIPIPFIRPVQAKPAVQVPLLPVPQQACPSPPQVPHWLPAADTMQARSVMQAVTAPASAPPPPPMVGQQGCPVPPQAAHIPGIPIPFIRPVQAKPAVQVPLLPVPQHGCPTPPQAPHWSPVAEIKQDKAVPHSAAAPAAVEQQGCPLPPHIVHIPGVPCAVSRPAHSTLAPVHEPSVSAPQQTCVAPPQAAHF